MNVSPFLLKVYHVDGDKPNSTQKPLYLRGFCFLARSPHLAEQSAGIGTLPARLQAGCRASTGRFPPPLLMRAGLTTYVQLYMSAGLPAPVYPSNLRSVKIRFHHKKEPLGARLPRIQVFVLLEGKC